MGSRCETRMFACLLHAESHSPTPVQSSSPTTCKGARFVDRRMDRTDATMAPSGDSCRRACSPTAFSCNRRPGGRRTGCPPFFDEAGGLAEKSWPRFRWQMCRGPECFLWRLSLRQRKSYARQRGKGFRALPAAHGAPANGRHSASWRQRRCLVRTEAAARLRWNDRNTIVSGRNDRPQRDRLRPDRRDDAARDRALRPAPARTRTTRRRRNDPRTTGRRPWCGHAASPAPGRARWRFRRRWAATTAARSA